MPTATPYDPKNRTLSKTIYYSHQDGKNAGEIVTSSPFPTAYENRVTLPTVVQECVIDFNNSVQAYRYDDYTNAPASYLQSSTQGNLNNYVDHVVTLINNSTVGTWNTATASNENGNLKITNTVAFNVRIRDAAWVYQTSLMSGGTVEQVSGADEYMSFAVSPGGTGQSSRDFADGLIEGGSSYTAEVLQGA